MQHKRFTRNKEDFECAQCGAFVVGDGYTNHCPECLCSKHVDIHPGDRAATCLGLMQPVGLSQKDGEYVITQRCVRCGHERRNKRQEADSAEAIIALSLKPQT